MLFSETIAVYCENHTERINTVCVSEMQFPNIAVGGIYIVISVL
jgi:hypothetical protein